MPAAMELARGSELRPVKVSSPVTFCGKALKFIVLASEPFTP